VMVACLLARLLWLVFPSFEHNEFICVLVHLSAILMCLAIPAKVVNIKGDDARVDFGEGVLREVNVMLVDAKVGDYVLVHAGYAIEVLSEEEALETLRLWNEILDAAEA
jgi:hydrogenase expression/formation protein HypC